MRKRRTNLNLVFRGGLVCFALLSAALPGCKKKAEPPPQAVIPMPQKPVQQNVSTNKKAVGTPAPAPAAPVAAQAPAKPATPAASGAPPVPAKPAAPVAPGAAPVPPKPAAPVATGVAQPSAGVTAGIQKQVSSGRLAPAPAGISLDFTNRRDPFRPFVQAPPPTAAGKVARSLKDALPIQSFDTEKFRVTGIITGVRENSALVIDPNGKGYVVREGMMLGSNDGRIKRITSSTVEVEENFRDDNGRVKKRVVKLALTRKK